MTREKGGGSMVGRGSGEAGGGVGRQAWGGIPHRLSTPLALVSLLALSLPYSICLLHARFPVGNEDICPRHRDGRSGILEDNH